MKGVDTLTPEQWIKQQMFADKALDAFVSGPDVTFHQITDKVFLTLDSEEHLQMIVMTLAAAVLRLRNQNCQN